jgi:dienelactone hydrolase
MTPMIRTSILVAALALPCSTDLHAQQPEQATSDALRARFLAVLERPRVPLAPSAANVTTESGYTRELLSFFAERDESVPVLVLRKADRTARQPVVIVLHGTGGSKEGTLPLLRTLVDRGFLAVSFDARFHGQRATPVPGLENPYQSAMLRAYRTGVGHPYLYDTVWDVMRLIDYLSTRSDIDPRRIGLVGHSKGGTEALLAAAADPRVAVVAPWIGVQSFSWSLRRPAGWEARVWTLRRAMEAAAADSNEVVNASFVRKFYQRIAPGLVDTFDGPAMLPLVAPRPIIVVNGDSDPRSPLGGVRESVMAAERAYAAAGVPDRFKFVLQLDAAHEVTPEAREATMQWLVRWLSPSSR